MTELQACKAISEAIRDMAAAHLDRDAEAFRSALARRESATNQLNEITRYHICKNCK